MFHECRPDNESMHIDAFSTPIRFLSIRKVVLYPDQVGGGLTSCIAAHHDCASAGTMVAITGLGGGLNAIHRLGILIEVLKGDLPKIEMTRAVLVWIRGRLRAQRKSIEGGRTGSAGIPLLKDVRSVSVHCRTLRRTSSLSQSPL